MTATLNNPLTRPNVDVDRTKVRFGVDDRWNWHYLRFTGIDNPHVLIIGGSQTGKTTLEILIAALAASIGCIVVILDPKMRFSKQFRHPETGRQLPNVHVYRNADPDAAAEEWETVLATLIAEMQTRYEQDEQASESLLSDHTRFPTIVVIADEFGTLLDFADKEWPHRKPEGYKGDTPIKEYWHTLMRMGAEARLIMIAANQTAAVQELPAGTRTRTLCGQRIALGTFKEGEQWRMIAGEGNPPVEVPDGQKGAGVYFLGTRKPLLIQCANIDWRNRPSIAYELATGGISILEADGHIVDGALQLTGGRRLPRPGRMIRHVAGTEASSAIPPKDFLAVAIHDEGESASDETGGQDPEDAFADAQLIRGLAAGAEFCGMTERNFRAHRGRHPIAREKKPDGKTPEWHEPDLREWSLMRGENRRNKKNNGDRESA